MVDSLHEFKTIKGSLLCYSDITWALWHLKSSATWLFVQQLILGNNKENIIAVHYLPFLSEFTYGFALQSASNVKSISITQGHHVS